MIKNIVAPLWAYKDGDKYFKYLKKFEESQFFDRKKIDEIQFNKLRQMVSYAFKNCNFYKEKYEEYGFEPKQLKSPTDVTKIPFITKEEIQKYKKTFVSKKYNVSSLIPDMTGGSTGSPLHYYIDKDVMSIRKAITIRHDRWAGWDIGKKVAYLWATHRDTDVIKNLKVFIRNFLLERSFVLNTSSIDKNDLKTFTEIIKKNNIQYFIGYASSIYLFAKYIRGIQEKNVHPKAIISSAEVLHDEQRMFIEETFQCKVFNRYGCRELNMIASECDRHEGMHLNADCLYMEILDGNSKEGLGELVITDLVNYAFPFIRYKIRDMACWADHNCSCGRGLPLIKSVNGRVADFIITPKGRLVSGPSVTITVIAIT